MPVAPAYGVIVNEVDKRLRYLLERRPGKPSSHYQRLMSPYWQSFELFVEKLQITSQKLSVPYQLDGVLFEFPADGASVREWEDKLDALEIELDALRLHKQQRQYFLSIIELIDSTDRLVQLGWPHTKGTGHKYYLAIRDLKRESRCVGLRLTAHLKNLGVEPITVVEGQYPPPESTRVIARKDHNTDDNIMVSEVIAKGYVWHTKLLRKADVIVTTNKGK